jgi:ATP-binding cassette subfamily B protein
MLTYLRPHSVAAIFLVLTTIADSVIIVSTPLLLKRIIDHGILRHDAGLVTRIALFLVGLAILDALLQLVQSYFAALIGQGVSYDLRVQAFTHVQRQPLAFFTRTQIGSLTSRLNTDVAAAQQAFATLLVSISGVVTLILVLVEMFYLSWVVSAIALVIMPLFIAPGALIGRRLQRYSREQMQVNAEMGATINERFNVAGAMLAKLFGRPKEEADLFTRRARRVREIGVVWQVHSRLSFVLMTMLASVITAIVYGIGGHLTIDGRYAIGTLVALAALLGRLYGPITQLSTMQANALTAIVSFDRIFEILDLKPLIEERPDAVPLAASSAAVAAAAGNGAGGGDVAGGAGGAGGAAPEIRFERVSFSYPRASEVSLASLESAALPEEERAKPTQQVLHDLSFRAPAGQLTALVGPSGAGKTTITHLVSRLYDPTAGAVRIDGTDLRDVRLESLRQAVGVVTQDAHFFHDTIRNNLLYARPDATEPELLEACDAAQIGGHSGGRSRLPPVRRRETATGAGQAAVEAAVDRGARRGHGTSGLRVRGRHPACARDRAPRPYVRGDRAPVVHHPRGRSDPRHRRRAGTRARHP